MKMKFLGVIFSLCSYLVADDISVAKWISDPSFEKAGSKNVQINAPGRGELNGWRAFPQNVNEWTSVGYVVSPGKTTGDEAPVLTPSDGNAYLRMFTFNSCDWLALATPQFPVRGGRVYTLCFDLAKEQKPSMAFLKAGLEIDGKIVEEHVFDLLTLDAGWNTVVCRFAYKGPAAQGRIVLKGIRETKNICGTLNLDHFRMPSADDVEMSISPIKGK